MAFETIGFELFCHATKPWSQLYGHDTERAFSTTSVGPYSWTDLNIALLTRLINLLAYLFTYLQSAAAVGLRYYRVPRYFSRYVPWRKMTWYCPTLRMTTREMYDVNVTKETVASWEFRLQSDSAYRLVDISVDCWRSYRCRRRREHRRRRQRNRHRPDRNSSKFQIDVRWTNSQRNESTASKNSCCEKIRYTSGTLAKNIGCICS